MASVKTTITDQGLALMNTIIADSGKLTFTGIEVGDGLNINTSARVTELVNKRMDVAVSKVYASEDGTIVCGNVENSTVTESFDILEIGVFAKQEGSEDAPILFAYTECEGVGGIPAASIVAINNEVLITIATGNANVLYIDNPTATVTRQDIAELSERVTNLSTTLKNNYFTKNDIISGVQTQTIFGYDPITETETNNVIYLTGDTISVFNKGNEVVFPAKAGTIALTSDLPTTMTTDTLGIGKLSTDEVLTDGANVGMNADSQLIVPIANVNTYGVVKPGSQYVVSGTEPYVVGVGMSTKSGKEGQLFFDLQANGFLKHVYKNGVDTTNGFHLCFDQSKITEITDAAIKNSVLVGAMTGEEKNVAAPELEDNANIRGWVGTFADLGCEGNAVVPKEFTFYRRTQNGGDNNTAYLYLRILRNVDGAWTVAYESSNSVRASDTYNAGDPLTPFTLVNKDGRGAIPTDERIAIVEVNDTSLSASSYVTFGAKMTSTISGALSNTSGITSDANAELTTMNVAPCMDIAYFAVEDLQDTLDSKAETDHTHEIADVNGLQEALDGKADDGHAHAIDDVDGLQTALDGKSDDGHTHEIRDVTNLQSELDARTTLECEYDEIDEDTDEVYATIALGDNGKSLRIFRDIARNGGGTLDFHFNHKDDNDGGSTEVDVYTDVEVDNLLKEKADSEHTHAISDVDGLQTALDGKAAADHTHDDLATGGFGIDPDGAASQTVNQTYDETNGYVYACDVTPTENGYLSCQATQSYESEATNKIILTCTINGVVIHKDCSSCYGDMASILIPVASGQTVNVQATSTEPATVEVKFMPLKS